MNSNLPKPEQKVFDQVAMSESIDKWPNFLSMTPQKPARYDTLNYRETPQPSSSSSTFFAENSPAGSTYCHTVASENLKLSKALRENASLLYVSHNSEGIAGDLFEAVIDLQGRGGKTPNFSTLKRNSVLDDWQFQTPEKTSSVYETAQLSPLRNAFRQNSCLLSSPIRSQTSCGGLEATPSRDSSLLFSMPQTPSFPYDYLLDSDWNLNIKTPPKNSQELESLNLRKYNFYLGFGNVFIQDTLVSFDLASSRSIITLAGRIPESHLACDANSSTPSVPVFVILVPKQEVEPQAATWQFGTFTFTSGVEVDRADRVTSSPNVPSIHQYAFLRDSLELCNYNEKDNHQNRIAEHIPLPLGHAPEARHSIFKEVSKTSTLHVSSSGGSQQTDYSLEESSPAIIPKLPSYSRPIRALMSIPTPPQTSMVTPSSHTESTGRGLTSEALTKLQAFYSASMQSEKSAFYRVTTPKSTTSSSRSLPQEICSDGEVEEMARRALTVIATGFWTRQEKESGRRVIKFLVSHRSQELCIRPSIHTKQGSDSDCSDHLVSCIFYPEKHQYVITTVDIIRLLSYVADAKFSISDKNRIRRNLQVFKPATVLRSSSFFRRVMEYSNPPARSIEKKFKVLEFELVYSVLRKIVPKYSAYRSIKLSFS